MFHNSIYAGSSIMIRNCEWLLPADHQKWVHTATWSDDSQLTSNTSHGSRQNTRAACYSVDSCTTDQCPMYRSGNNRRILNNARIDKLVQCMHELLVHSFFIYIFTSSNYNSNIYRKDIKNTTTLTHRTTGIGVRGLRETLQPFFQVNRKTSRWAWGEQFCGIW